MDSHIQKKYEVEKRLGKGAYGIVWKATSKRWVTSRLACAAFQTALSVGKLEMLNDSWHFLIRINVLTSKVECEATHATLSEL